MTKADLSNVDVTLMFISGIIMTIVGFITQKYFGFNVSKLKSDLVAMVVLVLIPAIQLLFLPRETMLGFTEAMMDFLTNYLKTVTNMLPGMVIGEAVGSTIGKFVEIFRQF